MNYVTYVLIPPDKLNIINWEANIFMYGLPAALLALETLEQDEFYEECVKLQKTIEDIGQKVNYKYPTRFSEEFFDSTIEQINYITGRDTDRDEMRRKYDMYASGVLVNLGYTWK